MLVSLWCACSMYVSHKIIQILLDDAFLENMLPSKFLKTKESVKISHFLHIFYTSTCHKMPTIYIVWTSRMHYSVPAVILCLVMYIIIACNGENALRFYQNINHDATFPQWKLKGDIIACFQCLCSEPDRFKDRPKLVCV